MMPNEKSDRRTAYSKRVIRESLYELLKEKPLNKISVKEICEKADVNRSTFYAYYFDIYDLHEKILDDFFEKQREMIEHTKKILLSKPDITDLSVHDFYDIAFYYLTVVKENKSLYKFIFNQNSTNSSHIMFGKAFSQEISSILTKQHSEDIIEYFKRSFNFISGGTTSIIMSWLKFECAEPTESVAKSLSYYYNGVFNGHKFKK